MKQGDKVNAYHTQVFGHWCGIKKATQRVLFKMKPDVTLLKHLL